MPFDRPRRGRAIRSIMSYLLPSPYAPRCRISRGRTRSGRQLGGELAEDLDVTVDIGLVVLYRQRPLVVGTGRQEDAAVGEEEEAGRPQIGVEADEVAVVRHPLRSEHHAAL